MSGQLDCCNSIVSIIVPAFNAQKYIERCISALQKQTYSNIEIILVDDGSTDSTGAIVAEFAKVDSRIKIISQNNSGVSAARNNAIKSATGDWIMFCDSDDEYPKNAVERLLSEAIGGDFDVISGSHTVVTASGVRKYVEVKNQEFHAREDIVNYFFGEGADRNFIWERIYRKSVFDDIEFKIGRYYEDVIFTLDMCNAINSFKVFNESVYDYRLNSTSLTSGVRKEVHIDLLNARLEQLEYIKKVYPQLKGRVYDLILTACCFIMSRFAMGKVEKQDADYQKVLQAFRDYKKIAPKGSAYIKVACCIFSISPTLLAFMCMVYSNMKNR